MAASLTLLATADVTGDKIDAAPGIEPTKPKRIDVIAEAGQVFVLGAYHRQSQRIHWFWGTDLAKLKKISRRPEYLDYQSDIIQLLASGATADHGYENKAEAV